MTLSISTLEEDVKRVKALHQWLANQDIPREQWGPVFALALGQEVWHHGYSNTTRIINGQLMVTEMLVRYSTQEILNV